MNVQTINIALPKDLVIQMDRFAKVEYRNRSEFIREAVRVYMDRQAQWNRLFAYGKSRGRLAGVKSEKDVDTIVASYRHGSSR